MLEPKDIKLEEASVEDYEKISQELDSIKEEIKLPEVLSCIDNESCGFIHEDRRDRNQYTIRTHLKLLYKRFIKEEVLLMDSTPRQLIALNKIPYLRKAILYTIILLRDLLLNSTAFNDVKLTDDFKASIPKSANFAFLGAYLKFYIACKDNGKFTCGEISISLWKIEERDVLNTSQDLALHINTIMELLVYEQDGNLWPMVQIDDQSWQPLETLIPDFK